MLFNIGDCVEFCLESKELMNLEKVIHVQGYINRINELGCFISITQIKPQSSLLLNGRSYHIGDEIYVDNSLLKQCSAVTKSSPVFKEDHKTYPWKWFVFFFILLILIVASLSH